MNNLEIKDEIIRRKIQKANSFNGGVALVKVEGTNGFITIDEKGNQISNNKILGLPNDNSTFHDGYAVVISSYHRYGCCGGYTNNYAYINETGKKVTREFYAARDFSEGIAWITDFDYKMHPINKEIEIAFNIENVTKTTDFHEGICFIKQGKSGFKPIDKTGQIVFECEYSDVSDYSNGFASVKEIDKDYWTIIDKMGKKVCDKKFKSPVLFTSIGYAVVEDYENSNSKKYLINKQFERESIDYDYINILQNGSILARRKNIIYFMDKELNVLSKIEDSDNDFIEAQENSKNTGKYVYLKGSNSDSIYIMCQDGSFTNKTKKIIGEFSDSGIAYYKNLFEDNYLYFDENLNTVISGVPLYKSIIKTQYSKKEIYGINEEELNKNKIYALNELKKELKEKAVSISSDSCESLIAAATIFCELESKIDDEISDLRECQTQTKNVKVKQKEQ